eukprot:TRINITY_DN3484_c0_g1_i9.p1 TRINITY_DN3484_c0_g1~~TRINITY_DN3484_c0_g1_i9.p1  ORF type:complete len:622 (-),score=116.14 TRINITY_DN3484_c0_g1_i9:40-1905(-)
MLRVNYENHKDLVSYGVKTVSEYPALKDCLVLCSNGEKEVNSLILGLLFPVLGKCDVFHFPVTQTVILQGLTVSELETSIEKLERSLSRIKYEPVEVEYVEEVALQESSPVVDQNDPINQELAHIFGAEILNTLVVDLADPILDEEPEDLQTVDSDENLPLAKDKEFSCPVQNCTKKFKLVKLLTVHMKNAHSSPARYIHTTPIKNITHKRGLPPSTPSPSKTNSLSASPTSSPLKFVSPVKRVIPVQTLIKCDFQGCGKTFQKQQTFLKHKSTHKSKQVVLDSKNEVLEHVRPQVSVQTRNKEIDMDQFYEENDILGEQFGYKNDKSEFKCLFDKCRAEFTYRHELRKHYIDHEESEFMCPECDIKFDLKTSMNEHRFKAHHILTVRKDMCLFCDALFFTKESFRNHILLKHRGPWKCETCDEKFFTLNEFKQHRLDHTETNLTCDWPNCNIIFASRDQLKAHLCTHETEEFYTCPNYLCNFFFCTLQGFERHLKSHAYEDTFDCVKCNKKYYNMRQFECHIEAGHMQNPRAFEFASEVNMDCPVENCKRSFVQEKWLLKHLKTHMVQNENGSNQKPRRSRNTAVKVIKVQKADVKPVQILESDQISYDNNALFFRMEST